MPDLENEVILRQVLRIYRNAVVAFLRARLTAGFADPSAELAALFGKTNPNTGMTQWQTMRANALAARAAPEVSTTVADDFELLGVAEFYPVFEKFFDFLFPHYVPLDAALKAERRRGILRCLRQIKVVRDPRAHEVTEDMDKDALTLSMANAVTVLRECSAEGAANIIRGLLHQLTCAKADYSASLFSFEKRGHEIVMELKRVLQSRGVTCRELKVLDHPLPVHVEGHIQANTNVVSR
jgi:hypothetical protein